MRDQFGIAVPRHAFAQAPADRQTTEADIGQRHRLHRDMGMLRAGAERVMHRADQRGAERQHAGAVARGALGEQHHRVAAEQAARDRPRGGAGLLPGLPVDEDGPLQSREPAEHRPSRDLALGDEHHRSQCADDADVEPRHVVGQDQRRTGCRSFSDLANPNPDQRAENAMVQMRNNPLQRQIEQHADQLERQQHQRECDESECDEYDADHERFVEGGAGAPDRAAWLCSTTPDGTKKCGPGQTRRLTGTAGGA